MENVLSCSQWQWLFAETRKTHGMEHPTRNELRNWLLPLIEADGFEVDQEGHVKPK